MNAGASTPRFSNDPKEPLNSQLIRLTTTYKIEDIIELLNDNPYIDIIPIHDPRSYTLLHIASFNNSVNITKYFLDFLRSKRVPLEKIKEWVNAKTNEGFTAMHFASFKGNIEIIKLLEQNYADIHAKNDQGLSMIHIAAQGDQPVSIAYFQFKGLNIEEVDAKGSTPLHWACFLGMENSVTYLTTWGCSTNLQDYEFELTPLHLGVISGNPRIVRRLLIKGAKKNVKNKEEKLPIDLAYENEYDDIAYILKEKNWLFRLLNIRTDFPKKNSRIPLIVTIAIFTIVIGTNIFFIFPYVDSISWVLSVIFLVFLTLIFFSICWLMDPGYLNNPNKSDILNLLLNYDPQKICPECAIIKPERSRHCDYCETCVSVYDHHCPWIYNCIGSRNHRFFLVFILSLFITILTFFALGWKYFDWSFDRGEEEPSSTYFPKVISDNHTLYLLKQMTCIGDFLVLIVFGMPLLALLYIQIGNFILGKTTSERYGFHPPKENLNESLLQSNQNQDESFTLGRRDGRINPAKRLFRNCYLMCFENQKTDKYSHRGIESANMHNKILPSDLDP